MTFANTERTWAETLLGVPATLPPVFGCPAGRQGLLQLLTIAFALVVVAVSFAAGVATFVAVFVESLAFIAFVRVVTLRTFVIFAFGVFFVVAMLLCLKS